MSDFIPGEAYRIDVVGVNENILVDSWNNQIKANVVSQSGLIQVDTESGKIYGPFIGNVENYDGDVIIDITTKTVHANSIYGDLYGTVYGDLQGNFSGDLKGDVYSLNDEIIVDVTTKTVHANAVYGDFYGNLYGDLHTQNPIYGTFSGEFNGTGYGEYKGTFVGEITGNVTGNLSGDSVGTHYGDLFGNLLTYDNSSLTYYNTSLNSYVWLGGIEHPNKLTEEVNPPILVLGDTRKETTLISHIRHYDNTPVLSLNDSNEENTYKATFFGKVDGEVYKNNQVILNTLPFTTLHSSNNQLRLNAETGVLEFFAGTIKKMLPITNTLGVESFQTYRGTFENRQAVQPGDKIAFSFDFWDGENFKQGGALLFKADPNNNHNTHNNFYPTSFTVVCSDGVSNISESTPYKLEFKNGILSSPMFKVGSKTFAEIDSLRPDEGTIVFNTSNKKFQGWTGTHWVDLH